MEKLSRVNVIKGFPPLSFKWNMMICKFPSNPETQGFHEFGNDSIK